MNFPAITNIPALPAGMNLMGTLFIWFFLVRRSPEIIGTKADCPFSFSLLHLWRRVRDEVNCSLPGCHNSNICSKYRCAS